MNMLFASGKLLSHMTTKCSKWIRICYGKQGYGRVHIALGSLLDGGYAVCIREIVEPHDNKV